MFEEVDLTYVEYVHRDAMQTLTPHVNRVLDAIGHPEAWVGDDSTMGDFGLSRDELALVGQMLGLSVGEDDYLYAVAFRLKARAA